MEPSCAGLVAARRTLLTLLDNGANHQTGELIDKLTQLDPTVRDLSAIDASVALRVELRAAVRRNSPLMGWLAALPFLPTSSQ